MSDDIKVGIKVGTKMVHVERFGYGQGGLARKILDVKIVRETPTRWVDDHMCQWNKATLAQVPQYAHGPRYLMTPEAFAAQVTK